MRTGNLENSKKVNRKIALFIIFVIFCTLLYMPNKNIKADDNIITYDDKIKILEIEPGNQYLLGGASTDDKPITTNSTDGHSVSITRMPMTKFISMVDEISGQYDVVVIGRENGYTWQDGQNVWQDGKYVWEDGWHNGGYILSYGRYVWKSGWQNGVYVWQAGTYVWEDGKYVVKSGKTGLNSKYVQGTPYRDYTKPASQTYPSLPLTWWKSSDNPQMVDGINMIEYYSENDITDKRAKEIISMIKSGQLIYVDNSIFTSDTAKEISTTKLYKTFKKDIKNYPDENPTNNAWKDNTNFKSLNQSEINIDSIVRDYISSNNKRPKVKQIIKPTDDGNITDTKGQLSNRQMNFNITMGETGTFRAKLYLDINADGLFKDTDKAKELVETDEFTVDSQNLQHILQHSLDKDFIGYLDWKIEISKVSNAEVKTNLLGSSKYKPLSETRTINVLQIKTNREYQSGGTVGNGNLIDLSTDTNFKNLINSNAVKNDYTVNVTSMTIKDANYKALNGTLVLNGKYNMVILGFEDGFGVYSGNFEDFNDSLIALLKEYIKTGQSVMFTHDTMAPALAYADYGYITGAQKLTRAFRDYIGQARYPDPYRSKEKSGTNLSGGDGTISITDGKYNIDESDLTKDRITHESYPNSSAYSTGTSLQGYVYSKSPWKLGWTPDIQKAKKINSAQISQYPFAFTDNMGLPRDIINVAKTHAQWFQLNLEDENVVPWFNLSDNNTTFDSLDSRNNYYTYSKGNITYSGTGHSKDSVTGFPDDELKLFVNTMIKAERGANHAPTINCSIPLENTDANPQLNNVAAGKDYYFSVDAEDYEKENIKMHITINGRELNSDNIVSTINLSEINNQKIFQIETSNSKRTSVKFKIPADQLQESGENIKVVVEAQDSQNAKSLKNYVLKPVKSTSSIDVAFESAEPNPAAAFSNSNINVKYKITPNDYYYKTLNSEGPIEEAVFLVDLSNTMSGSYNRFSQLQNGVPNVIINGNNPKLDKIKLGVIGFNDSVYIGSTSNINNVQDNSILRKIDGNLNNIDNISKDKIYPFYLYNMDRSAAQYDYAGYRRFYAEDSFLKSKISNNDQRQLGTALEAADNVLTQYGKTEARKAIVIISSGELTYSDADAEIIRNKGYKIITLDISNSINNNIEATYEKLGGDINSKTGEKVDYFKGTFSDNQNYNSTTDDLIKVANSLNTGMSNNNIIKNAKLNLNLGSNFQMMSSAYKFKIPSSTEWSDGGSIIDNTGNKYSLDLLNKINYVATTETDSEGRIKYVANPFEITFQVKPTVQSYGNFGFSGLTFEDDDFNNNKLKELGTDLAQGNNFVYSDVFMQHTDNIFTPVVRIIPNITLKHGIYEGMDSSTGNPIIYEAERNFAKGATVTFGAYIDGAINNKPIQINFDSRLTDQNIDLSKIKVFTIENGQMHEIVNNSGSLVNKTYTYIPSGLSDSGGKVLILYTEKLPEVSNVYTNTLKVMDMPERYARIAVADKNLPDLF